MRKMQMRIVVLEPNVCVMAGMVRLAYMMADVFKGLGHKVKVVGRVHGEIVTTIPVEALAGKATAVGGKHIQFREGLVQKHFDVKDLRLYQPVRHLTPSDVLLRKIPVCHPFMYFADDVRTMTCRADVMWTGSEIYVKLPEILPGVEKKQIQYVHWPLTTLKPVKDHEPRMIWANSLYTQKHIKDVWGLTSEVVYPPTYCDLYANKNEFDERPFDVVLLGRLDASKMESVMPALKNFKVAVVGSAYGYEKDLPSWVTLYKNATMKEVANVLGQSKVYVHGKGFGKYGGGRQSEPEHFGQTIVEAMASGCVPIVPNMGGPIEIVGAGEQHGYLFSSMEKLRRTVTFLTREGVKDIWTEMSEAAVKRAHDFDVSVVSKQVEGLLKKMGEG
jgi:glycosyltransferase involved in cell wall biosynthesis